MRYLWIIILCLAGCNTIEISAIKENESEIIVSEYLNEIFTPEANAAISEIKIYEGLHIYPYVPGVNGWSTAISILTFNGWGRKIICTRGSLYDNGALDTIVHEYVHHIDDMTRDGDIQLIDHAAFSVAYQRMREDPTGTTTMIASDLLSKADKFITNVFGIGPDSELIAYTASWIVAHPDECPLYMHRVFKDILTISRARTDNSF